VNPSGRLILIDPDAAGREMLAERLRMQGYHVVAAAGPAEGAVTALSNPPSAVIADLWMPSISGVQLCRLLKAEPRAFAQLKSAGVIAVPLPNRVMVLRPETLASLAAGA